MVATPAMAWLGFGPLRPAAAKASGTTTAMPRPISAEPGHRHGRMPRDDDQQRRRAAASTPPARTVRTAPKRSTTVSPGEPGRRPSCRRRRWCDAAARPGRGVQHVPQIDRRPVQARALREHRAEPDRADEQRRLGRQREPRRRILVLGGAAQIQHAPAGDHAEQRSGRTAASAWCSRASEPSVRGDGAGRRADQGARAPHAVQPGHDRLAEPVLDLDAQRVHRHVRHARRVAPYTNSARHSVSRFGASGGQDQRQRPQGEQPAQGGAGAEAVADPRRPAASPRRRRSRGRRGRGRAGPR